MKTKHAFTLVELLVTIAIIVVLATIAIPAFAAVRKSADRSHTANNFKQLGAGLTLYIGQHDNCFPLEGEERPSWESCAEPEESEAWYNAIPRLLGSKGAADFAGCPAEFYKKPSLLYVPAAQYPKDKDERPMFALAINSKLRAKNVSEGNVRLANVHDPARTVAFQESGLPGEPTINGQDPAKYDGQPKTFANRSVARYAGKVLIIFADSHIELVSADAVVDSNTGKAYYPQTGEHPGRVIWTLDPTADANK